MSTRDTKETLACPVATSRPPAPSKPIPEYSAEERRAFEEECIAGYVRKYRDILMEKYSSEGWSAAEKAAQDFLREVFSKEGDPSELIDLPIRRTIRAEVFRRAEDVHVWLFVELSG